MSCQPQRAVSVHLNLLYQTRVSAPSISLGLCLQASLSPSPFFLSSLLRSLLPLSLPRTALGFGSGNAAGSSSPATASSITRVSAPAGWGGRPFLYPSDPPVIPHPSSSFADSREESVLGSVLLPSYSIRPDGPGAPRGRRFTFTVSPSNLHGH